MWPAASAQWTTRASGVPLLVGALSAIDCEAEDIVERHSHALVIGRVLDIQTSQRTAALAYWQGRYVLSIRTRMWPDWRKSACRPRALRANRNATALRIRAIE
ncbi:MAG: flavin reductase family protein [Rudaea sp.]|nr:flavin reductase family protein [Rudaea sp.]